VAVEAVAMEHTLAETIAERTGVNVFQCFQCARCTSGCPVAEHFDLAPNRIMRAVQMGRAEESLLSRSIWLCASCQTCSSRCPQELDVARVLDTLRIMAQEQGLPPAVPPVRMFSQSALRGIRRFGRMYELGLMAELYGRLLLARLLDLRQLLTADVPVAVRLLARGKLRLLPRLVRQGAPSQEQPARVEPAAAARLRVGYYPGCSLHGTAVDFGMSTRAVAGHLGIELVEPRGWVCCGTSPAHTTDHTLATLLPMRNLALFEAAGLDSVMMPCASCYARTKTAIYDVQHEPELRTRVAEETGYRFEGHIAVEHIVEMLEERVGLARIAEQVRRPLSGLKVVCYYGCLLTRPPKVLQRPHPEYPRSMDRLVETLGAQTLDWSYKTECCGGSLSFSQLRIALQLCERILRDAQEAGADAVVVACPLCHANLDVRQNLLDLPGGRMPILYITQLMGLAFGLPPRQLGLDKHLVDPMQLLCELGLANPRPVPDGYR
jgi:heterodisulfide reductase subunit B